MNICMQFECRDFRESVLRVMPHHWVTKHPLPPLHSEIEKKPNYNQCTTGYLLCFISWRTFFLESG